jgi:ankyrin repeat protein
MIQTIVLTCKTNPHDAVQPTNIEAPREEESKWSGPTDEQYANMEDRMFQIDNLFSQGLEEREKRPCETQYCKPTSVINRRDHLGRTPLFVAVAFNNKQAVETLLYLGANPHIEDIFGQRPSDICYVDAITSLLLLKMTAMSKPSQPIDIKMDADDKVNLNTTSVSTKSKTLVSKEEKTYPLEIRDLKQIPKEKVIAARIGSDQDTYLHYAISKRRRDLLIFLLENVTEIPLDSKNSQG